ncbi:MAG: hypothetical protein M3R13_10890 [Armatimonadota bacterium]|nr:hypothetical protein [Armatimonadota bacterium]
MKRPFVALTLMAAAAAFAQTPFTIVKPGEGAKVRETVPITMPRNSVPEGSFIGITIDGKFLEAVVPQPNAAKTHLVYWLDTKKMGIADGWHQMGVTLFSSVNGRHQAVDQSEVRVHVGNHTGIDIPANGLPIRYKFNIGSQWIYNVTVGMDLSTLTEVQNKLGGRAAQLPFSSENWRFVFAVDDVRNGLGLIRSQFLPYKGKDYLVLTTSEDGAPTQHFQKDFAPLYRLLRPTGAEVYADIPNYFEIEGTGSGNLKTSLIGFMALPILPSERLQIGDSWQAAIDMMVASLVDVRRTGTAASRIPARGTFEAVEWEKGEPCAKLRYELEQAVGSRTSRELEMAGREFKDNDRLRIEQLAWISIRSGKLVRLDMVIEADTKAAVGDGGGTGGGGGRGGPQPMGGGGGGEPTPAGMGGGGRGRGGQAVGSINLQEPQGMGGRGGGRRFGGGGEGGGQAGAPGGGGNDIFIRQKLYLKMVLE